MFLCVLGCLALVFVSTSAQDAPCNLRAICYALDHSGTLNDTEYVQLQEFTIGSAVSLSNTLPLGVGTQYSAVGFSTDATEIVTPTSDVEVVFVPAIRESINSRGRGFTDIYDGMRLCKTYLDEASAGVAKVLVVATDGQHNEGGANPAQSIKEDGVTIVMIAVGSATRDQDMLEWSSGEQYFFKTTFAEITNLTDLFVNRACSSTVEGSNQTEMLVGAEAKAEAQGSVAVGNSLDMPMQPSNTPITVGVLPMVVTTSTSAATAASTTISTNDAAISTLPFPIAPTTSSSPSPIIAIPPPTLSPTASITPTPSPTRTPSIAPANSPSRPFSSPILPQVLPIDVPFPLSPSIPGISFSSPSASASKSLPTSTPSTTQIDIDVLPLTDVISPSPSISKLAAVTATSTASSSSSMAISITPTTSSTLTVVPSPTASSSLKASVSPSFSTIEVEVLPKSMNFSPEVSQIPNDVLEATSSPSTSAMISPTSSPSATISSSSNDVLSVLRLNCEIAFKDCDFTFQGTNSLSTFGLPAPSPDVPFTPRIVSKDPRKFIGVVNTAKFPAQFIDDANVSRSLTNFGNPPFAPTAIKAELISSFASGIAHQYLEGNQIWELHDKCVRIYFDAYQILLPGSMQVAGNLNFDQPEAGACVVFLTTA